MRTWSGGKGQKGVAVYRMNRQERIWENNEKADK